MTEFKTPFATEIQPAAVAALPRAAAELLKAQQEEYGRYIAASLIQIDGANAFLPGHAVPVSMVSDTGPVYPNQVMLRTPAVERQVAAATSTDATDPSGEQDQKPAGNATAEEWRAYAIDHGVPEDEAAGMGRDELRARF